MTHEHARQPSMLLLDVPVLATLDFLLEAGLFGAPLLPRRAVAVAVADIAQVYVNAHASRKPAV